jgi:hypothetical protein
MFDKHKSHLHVMKHNIRCIIFGFNCIFLSNCIENCHEFVSTVNVHFLLPHSNNCFYDDYNDDNDVVYAYCRLVLYNVYVICVCGCVTVIIPSNFILFWHRTIFFNQICEPHQK